MVDFAFAVETRKKLLAIISALIAAILILKLIYGSLETMCCETRFRKCKYVLVRKLYEKQLCMDYENLEKPAVKTLFEGAKQQSVNSMMEFFFRVRETIGLFFFFCRLYYLNMYAFSVACADYPCTHRCVLLYSEI